MTNATNSVAINNLINEVLRKYFIAYPEKQEGYTPVLVNVDCPVSVEDFSELSRCVRNYDLFTKYIENYKQEKEAEKRNKELNIKFQSILVKYGIEDVCNVRILKSNCGVVGSRLCSSEETVAEYINELFNEDSKQQEQDNVTDNNSTTEVKEEDIMKNDNNTTSNNSTNNNKEVITMTNEMIKKLDALNKVEQLVQVLEWCNNITNKHDVYYVKKEVLAKFLFDKDIIVRDLSKNELKRTGRDKLIDTLRETVNNLTKAGVIIPINTTQFNVANKETVMDETYSAKMLDCYFTINSKTLEILNESREVVTIIHNNELVAMDSLIAEEELINDIDTRRKYALIAAPIARKNFRFDMDYGYRILSEDNNFWCDCNVDDNGNFIIRVAYRLDKEIPEIINGCGCIINYNCKEESTVEFNDALATSILEKVIRQADTNKAHNFISDWMLTSIISELIIGLPLKDKGVEHYKTFTDDQKKNLVEIRKAFIKRAKLVAKYNNSKITGYYIPAKMLVWGRHKYLGVACVYRFMSGNKVAAEYHVSLNGIKNIATGTITALDDNAYATLDSKCVFVM